ncbi:hypothetical protein D9M69_708390 [compost metagenome]
MEANVPRLTIYIRIFEIPVLIALAVVPDGHSPVAHGIYNGDISALVAENAVHEGL